MRSIQKGLVLTRRVTVRLVVIVGLVTVQVLLVVACVLALRQNQTLRERAETFLSRAAPLVGRAVPPVSGLDLAGVRRTIGFGEDEPPTLVYVFSVNCPRSVSNWPAIRYLQRFSPSRLRIVYVDPIDPSGTLTNDFLQEHGIAGEPVFASLDGEAAFAFQVRGTPQAELVGRAGKVIWSKLGAFRPGDIQELLSAIETEWNIQ